jgi:hypothetical protein
MGQASRRVQRMDEVLYPHFATDFAVFLECRQFWLDLVHDVFRQGPVVEARWESWVDRGAPGKVLMDPPFDLENGGIVRGWSPVLRRQFRVIQTVAPGDDRGIGGYLEEEHDPRFSVDPDQWLEGLTVGVTLTARTAEVARSLLLAWCDPRTTYAEMEALMDEVRDRWYPPTA